MHSYSNHLTKACADYTLHKYLYYNDPNYFFPLCGYSRYKCYRTCYDPSENGQCVIYLRYENPVSQYATDPMGMFTAMKFSSPRYHNAGDNELYRVGSDCRYVGVQLHLAAIKNCG